MNGTATENLAALQTGTCLKFIPGEVIVVRSRHEAKVHIGSRFELGEIVESFPLERPEGDHKVLERIAVPIGLELRYLQIIAGQPGVFGQSLNYLGQSTPAISVQTTGEVEARWMERLVGKPPFTSKEKLMPDGSSALIVAVDTTQEHCENVLIAAGSALAAYGTENQIRLAGVYGFVTATTFGLYTYLRLVAKLLDIEQCPDAVILSVDFGTACLEADAVGGTQPLVGLPSVACYSFPIFEFALNTILIACSKHHRQRSYLSEAQGAPSVFAAAGNRNYNGVLRQRLAYPALRPEIFAVTHATELNGIKTWQPNATSDLPLAHDLKPVFVLSETVAKQHGAPTNGTSFAAPWCAAWYVSLLIKSREDNSFRSKLSTPLSRMAALQQLCSPIVLSGPIQNSQMSTPGLLIPPNLNIRVDEPIPIRPFGVRDTHNPLCAGIEVIKELNKTFSDWEFAVTGSVAAMLISPPFDEGYIASTSTDIDLVYLGEKSIDSASLLKIKDKCAKDFKGLIDISNVAVELTSADGRIAPFTLFQCIIPAACMYITAGGVLDAWHGTKDLENGRIRILQPMPGSPIKHPHALVEQYARLPSLLVAMALVCRLQIGWFSHQTGEFPDLEAPCSTAIEEAIGQDNVGIWTSRTFERLNKLSRLIEVIALIKNIDISRVAATNLSVSIKSLMYATATLPGCQNGDDSLAYFHTTTKKFFGRSQSW